MEVNNNMNNLKMGVIFSKEVFNDSLCLITPVSICLGELEFSDSESKMAFFKDIITSEIYSHIDSLFMDDEINGYDAIFDLDVLKKRYNTDDIAQVFQMFWNDIRKKVYFFDFNDKPVLQTMDIDEFNKRYTEDLLGYKYTYPSFDEQIKMFMADEFDSNENFDDNSSLKDVNISTSCAIIEKSLIGQSEAVKRVMVAIYKYMFFDNMKSNLLLIGPTGVGKTELLRIIEKKLNIPVYTADMTSVTGSGWKGTNPSEILSGLLRSYDGDIKRAERSILFLDEIDKKAGDDSEHKFSKEEVQGAFLKIIEGGTFDVEIEKGEYVSFDTSKLIIILGGAFTDLYKKCSSKAKIGFGEETKKMSNTSINPFSYDALVKYGIIPELMGRIDEIIPFNALGKDDFIKIMKESDINKLKQYTDKFKKMKIKLKIESDAYEEIANRALELGIGARGIKVVVEQVFKNMMYDIFDNLESDNRIVEIIITKETINDPSNYIMIRKNEIANKKPKTYTKSIKRAMS